MTRLSDQALSTALAELRGEWPKGRREPFKRKTFGGYKYWVRVWTSEIEYTNFPILSYATDITHAMDYLEWMEEKGWRWEICTVNLDPNNPLIVCDLYKLRKDFTGEASRTNRTLSQATARAIAEACYKALKEGS